jgi:hypothetical protein
MSWGLTLELPGTASVHHMDYTWNGVYAARIPLGTNFFKTTLNISE